MAVMKGPVVASVSAIATAATSSLSCEWTSAAQLVGQIQADKLIVPDVVAQCANVCQVAFNSTSAPGALAGEGIMISYLIQVALVCQFAVLLPITIWLFNIFSWKVAIQRTPLLRKLQKSVYEINAFFSISLLVASIVRWRQVPSVMETVLLSYVVWTQLLILTTMLFGQLCDSVMNKTNLTWQWLVYYMAIGIAQLLTSCVIEVPNRGVYKDLATQCHSQYGFINLSTYLPASEKGTTTLKWYIIGALIGLVIGILTGVFAKIIAKICPAWLMKHGEITFDISVLLLNLISVVGNAVITEDVRGKLIKLSGDQLPDAGWSYGQTTAILLWLPFFWGVVKETITHLRERSPVAQIGSEMQALGNENAPAPAEVPPPYTPQKGDAALPI
ncbi:hypothetical protein N431DRAFT_406712 [Stipitochalara longipes BDJ]|nr:hypothetical protein N431DRAFT_406712 [Stipitochalara longipes BDJ]